MAAYIRNNNPTIFTGIVNEDAGIAGGKFVVRDPATNKVTLAAANSDWANVYLTVNVKRNEYVEGSDATAVVKKGDLIAMCHPIPTDEYTLNTAITTTVGAKLGLAASGNLATATGASVRFVVTGLDPVFGQPGVQVRCIEASAT